MGSTPVARWQWLTTFAEQTLPTADADVRQLVTEVEVFALSAVESAGSAPQHYKPPRPADLPQLRAAAIELIRHVCAANGWRWFPRTSMQPGVWIGGGKEPGELTISTAMRTESAVDMFRAAMLALLLNLRDRLRLCRADDCRRPFVAARSHQRFCSTRCQNRAGLARYVDRRGGKEGFAKRRSDLYYARKEATLGKVKRRPRKG
jgi:hypothetical protein